jgi:type I restriction enzyme S subunit
MKYVALNKIARIDRTVASDEECKTLPYVGLEHIEKDAGHFAAEFEHKPETLLATKFRFTPRHVLYGKLRPYLNKVALPSFDGVCTTEILPILPVEARLDRTYLWAFLLTPGFVEWASLNVSGANLPRLSPKLLAQYEIPLPPLPEQQRIAAILGRADRLHRLRRTARDLSDTYLQSVFLEMFGDPATNPRRWECATIGDVVASSQYGTSQKSNSEQRGYPILGMGNITYSGRIDLTSLSYVELSRDEFEELRLIPGDIIFNRTNSTDLVGKTAHWNLEMDAVLASYLVRLKPNEQVLPDYFTALLNSRYYKRIFQERCRKAVGQSNISPTLLKEFPMLIPPLPLQQQFAHIVRKFERLRAQQREAERQAEYLFQALLHRAFRGEV